MGMFDKIKKIFESDKNKNNPEEKDEKIQEQYPQKEQEPKEPKKYNFAYMDELIHSGQNKIIIDADIVLELGEEEKYPEGIIIDVDNITLDGNGHTIDAQGKTRIFKITGKNITIKNITLKNGNIKDGGAIHNDKYGELTIINTTQHNNKAENDGGAIYNDGTLIIQDSTLKQNTALDGGAIYNNDKLTISETRISKNTAEHNGGAISNKGFLSGSRGCGTGEIIITNTILQKNRAKNGGAIHNYGTFDLVDSTLNFNKAENDGGAIHNEGRIIITDTTLKENIAENEGGAIKNFETFSLNVLSKPGEMKINKCELIKNSSEKGGAIHNDLKLTILNSRLEENVGTLIGGALFNHALEIRIINTSFKDNCSDSNINNIYNDGEINLKSVFFENKAKSVINEKKIYLNENDYVLCEKIENHGIIYNNAPLTSNQENFSYLSQLIFKDNQKIILDKDIVLDLYNEEELEYPNGIFINANNITIDGNGHTIDAKGKTRIFEIKNKNITLKNIILKNGLAKEGGAIYNEKGKLRLSKCQIINNNAIWGGGGIFTNSGELFIQNSELLNNNSVGGGALKVIGSQTIIEKTKFIKNNAESGGAIRSICDSHEDILGLVKCINSIFKNNLADEDGGAISHEQQIEIYNCEFINNKSNRNASDIYQSSQENSNVFIENSLFYNEKIKKELIYIYKGTCYCKKTKFHIIKSKKAFIINNDSGIVKIIEPTIKNINEKGNSKLKHEKYIYNDNEIKILKKDHTEQHIDNTQKAIITYLDEEFYLNSNNFTSLNEILKNSENKELSLSDNYQMTESEQEFFEGGIELDCNNITINGHGHSINANGLSPIFTVTGNNITLKNIKFENGFYHSHKFNSNILGGGAINIVYNSSLKIINCEFLNNISKNSAGAIANKGSLYINKTKFSNNNSIHNGGAIVNKGSLHINKTKFNKNYSIHDGGALYNYKNSQLTIKNCNFESNKCEKGGALKNEGENCIYNSKFIKNISRYGGAIYSSKELNIIKCILNKNESHEYLNRNSWKGGYGGAIYSTDKHFTLKNTELNYNNSVDGGAIWTKNKEGIINKCKFSNNFCERGGAIQNDQKLTVQNSTFIDNTVKITVNDEYDSYGTSNEQSFESDLHGASIYNDDQGDLVLKNSKFIGSRSDCIENFNRITLKNCSFEENHRIINVRNSEVNILENEKEIKKMIKNGKINLLKK